MIETPNGNTMKKIVVLISGSGSNLQAILDNCAPEGILPRANVVAVISNQPTAFGLERAQKAKVATHVLPHQGLSRDDYDAQLLACIEQYQPDVVVLAGFMRILSSTFVKALEGKLLNIHPSLLPKYPGLHTHQRALEAKDTHHGATVHFVIDELDAGPIIAQIQIPIEPQDTAETLQTRLIDKEHQLYPQAIQWVLEGKVRFNNGQGVWQSPYPKATEAIQFP